jgi:hypothetical protein
LMDICSSTFYLVLMRPFVNYRRIGCTWIILTNQPAEYFFFVRSFLLVSCQEKKCSRRKQKVAAHYDKSIICSLQT